jgi:5-methylcytosine-specific restriction endonuclease McrA
MYMGSGAGDGPCVCCKTKLISTFDFVCGHVKAEANGGETTVDNLRPICASCNSSMGTMNMQEFCRKYFKHDLI